MSPPDLQAQLSNVFVFAGGSSCLQNISDRDIVANRQKRPHKKSRNGCLNCKHRRVKCDEGSPSCSNCNKRGDECQRSSCSSRTSMKPHAKSPYVKSTLTIPALEVPTGVVNLFQMKLFYHFGSSTYKTLAFNRHCWTEAIKLSFEFEFLMQAILCLSAKHLAYLYPRELKYRTASATHLTEALRSFREILSEPFTNGNMPAIMFTAILLYYEAWSNVEFLATGSDNCKDYDAAQDPIFNLVSGMKQLFHSGLSLLVNDGCCRSTFLLRQANYKPSQVIRDVVLSLSRDPSLYQKYLEECFSDPTLLLSSKLPGPELQEAMTVGAGPFISTPRTVQNRREAYMCVVPRLSLLLSLLPEASRDCSGSVLDKYPDLLSDVSRTFFSFSILLDPKFIELLCENHQPSMMLMYHFYRAASQLLPQQECWWAARRSSMLQERLKAHLWG